MAELAKNVYANALFQVATEKNISEKMMDELSFLQLTFKENPDYLRLMDSPIVDKEKKVALLNEAFKATLSDYAFNLLLVLVDNLRFFIISDIVDEYRDLFEKASGIITVTAITATTLSDRLKEKLQEKLISLTNKKVKLFYEIDENILGGIKLKLNNTEIDATVLSSLNSLKRSLTQMTI